MRALLIVLDGLGVGEMPDARNFGDVGANTLGNIDRHLTFELPNLEKLGLGKITPLRNIRSDLKAQACWGKMAERSAAKDTVAGHWELMGVVVEQPFALFPDGFPAELITELKKVSEVSGVLANCAASGTEIINRLGKEHLQTGWPIVYTSADSVLQIAAHINVVPPEKLYQLCLQARKIADRYNICRVIARPFAGAEGNFYRVSEARRDFPLQPPAETVLDILLESNVTTIGVGKIASIFANRGIQVSYPTKNNRDSLEQILNLLKTTEGGLIFANLVDFDMLYGHRNDGPGFVQALHEFDSYLPKIIAALRADDLLIITADHGCDPFFSGTDHTREYVPLLLYSSTLEPYFLGVRETFADVGATLLDFFQIERQIFARSCWQK